MRLVKWPLHSDGSPSTLMICVVGEPIVTELWLIDAGGLNFILPVSVLKNIKEELERMDKLDHPKTSWPAYNLSLEQCVPVPHNIAKLLLEDPTLKNE
jgi:hypothetical protein